MNNETHKIFDEISGDKSDGATSLALRGLDALDSISPDLPDDPEQAMEIIVATVTVLDSLRPSMSAIGTQAVLAASRTRSLMASGLKPGAALIRATTTEREILGQANLTIANLASREIGPGGCIVSCSWSVTAMRALVALRPDSIRIGEGHRLGDGLKAAGWLAARGLEVEVFPDGALPMAVEGSRLVLVGADQVLADGSIINRCSTFSMAMAASYLGVPFVVACQRIKLGGHRHARIERADDLFGNLPPGVTARAPLFDVTPPDLVDSVITESGRLSPSEAGQVGEGIANLRNQILG